MHGRKELSSTKLHVRHTLEDFVVHMDIPTFCIPFNYKKSSQVLMEEEGGGVRSFLFCCHSIFSCRAVYSLSCSLYHDDLSPSAPLFFKQRSFCQFSFLRSFAPCFLSRSEDAHLLSLPYAMAVCILCDGSTNQNEAMLVFVREKHLRGTAKGLEYQHG